MKAFIILFIIFNLITFFMFGIDKLLARTSRKRISEKTLMTMAMVGGSVGAVFAQKLFRHKIRKFPFILWIILVMQFVVFEAIWNYQFIQKFCGSML
ncbi:MAG: DUF1294 domain-containing protein [Sulfuricurvum sp.]|nr:DUF1294 domain-containing protein [Sulfuricurvum sp.]